VSERPPNKKELAHGTQNTAEFRLFHARGSADRPVGTRNDMDARRVHPNLSRSGKGRDMVDTCLPTMARWNGHWT